MELADQRPHELSADAPVASPAVPRASAGVRRWLRTRLGHAPVVLVFALFVTTGFRGVDLGPHWDEMDWHVKPTRDIVSTGLLLPRAYVYPTLTKWLIMLPAVPAGLRAAIKRHGDEKSVQEAMVAAIDAPGFLLDARRVFIVVSALAILWIYGAALALRHTRWEALAAAAAFGLSWEIGYHARWVVTDCILVQFSALTLFMLALFHRTGRMTWLYAAAAAVGLGTGTKYPGAFLLLPVVLAGAFTLPLRPLRTQVKRAAALCALAFGVYLVTTPGTLLDPIKFFGETSWISNYYSNTHGGYTATSAWDHGRIALTFLALAFFSPYMPMAGALFACVVVGAVAWVRADRRFGAVLLCFPIAFLLVFCGKYRVAIVRNYLFLTPFLTILLVRGMAEVSRRLPGGPWARRGLAAVVFAALSVNAIWLVRAGESIRHVDPKTEVAQAIRYVLDHPRARFRLSPQVRALAASQLLTMPPNAPEKGTVGHVVFFGRAEGPNPWSWKANDPWLTEAVFGPREINFDWCTTWAGHDRVVVMTFAKAQAMGVPSAK